MFSRSRQLFSSHLPVLTFFLDGAKSLQKYSFYINGIKHKATVRTYETHVAVPMVTAENLKKSQKAKISAEKNEIFKKNSFTNVCIVSDLLLKGFFNKYRNGIFQFG